MRRIGKGKIRDDTKNQIKRERASGQWLHRNIPFNGNKKLKKDYETVADGLFKKLNVRGYKIVQKKREFQCLVANLWDAGKRKPVSISFNQNEWTITRYNKISGFVIDLCKKLAELGYIKIKVGIMEPGTNIRRKTRIYGTDKFFELFPPTHPAVDYVPAELVELRDDNGKLVNYKDTAKTYQIRKILERANKVNARAKIEYQGHKINAFLTAIFKRRFTLYGRLHTRGIMHYQGMKGDEREEITINGNPTVELDFSALHPMLLYAGEGIQYFGDPYAVIDNRSELRDFLKHILLCMLNASDFNHAQKGANNWLRNQPEEKREKIYELGITKARPLMEKFMEAHEPIAHHFCNGKETGLRIMNKDAEIALEVVNHFTKQGKPVLAIHDSFIVEKTYENELKKTMQKTYKKHTGFRIKIK